ncbi:hypothetical protein SDC9_73485 [bioreactor metagenome]|uniref:Chaperone protein Skp n=1 Tax=bioreactor metagenome TaxID=1076179 RepID=A0A644YEW3_9ZZZZ
MRKIQNVLIIAALVISIVSIAINIFHFSKDKVAYVDVAKVVKEFELSKSYQTEIELNVNKQKEFLDSLSSQMSVVVKKLTIEQPGSNSYKALEAKRDSLYNKIKYIQESFNSNTEKMVEKYNNEVFVQINQYIEEYGKTHDYSLILGAKGDGGIMYGSDANNITEDVIVFINKSYLGEK